MFPVPKKAAYIKFRNQASRYAPGRGVRRQASRRMSASPSPGAGSEGVFRVAAFEEALKKRFLAEKRSMA